MQSICSESSSLEKSFQNFQYTHWSKSDSCRDIQTSKSIIKEEQAQRGTKKVSNSESVVNSGHICLWDTFFPTAFSDRPRYTRTSWSVNKRKHTIVPDFPYEALWVIPVSWVVYLSLSHTITWNILSKKSAVSRLVYNSFESWENGCKLI